MAEDGSGPTNADFPLLKVLLSCHLDVDSRSSVALPTAASSALRTIRALTLYPNKRHRQMRRCPARLGDRFCPLPKANRSNISSDKQPSPTLFDRLTSAKFTLKA
jgi:hypothetical protein